MPRNSAQKTVQDQPERQGFPDDAVKMEGQTPYLHAKLRGMVSEFIDQFTGYRKMARTVLRLSDFA